MLIEVLEDIAKNICDVEGEFTMNPKYLNASEKRNEIMALTKEAFIERVAKTITILKKKDKTAEQKTYRFYDLYSFIVKGSHRCEPVMKKKKAVIVAVEKKP